MGIRRTLSEQDKRDIGSIRLMEARGYLTESQGKRLRAYVVAGWRWVGLGEGFGDARDGAGFVEHRTSGTVVGVDPLGETCGGPGGT